MRKLFGLLVLVLFLWPVAVRAQSSVALCAISGQVFNPDGTPLRNGVVQFNSQVTQVVGSTTIPPSMLSTRTDASGNMAAMSVAQGLFGQFTFCQGQQSTNVGGPGGGCAAPINGLIPINTTGNIQAIIAGTLLPSVGNATVNNLTVTGNTMVGGTLQVSGLSTLNSLAVTNNTTVGGTLNVTGNTTLSGTLSTGAVTAPTLNLTYTDCSALTLAKAIIASTPPNQDFIVASGAHCLPSSGGWVADANSAVLFGNYYNVTGPINNAGWQWLGSQGLTPGSTFTPTLLMTLSNAGTLSIPSLSTALTLAGGSVVSAGNPNMNYQMGAHYNGSAWIADATAAAGYSQFIGAGSLPTHEWLAATGLTVGAGISWGILGYSNVNGWYFNGSNPVTILQSNTNLNSDIVEILPQNQTQGLGLIWSGMHSIGSNATVAMNVDAKGGGSVNFNSQNTGGLTQFFSLTQMVNNNHLASTLNGGVQPTVSSCSVAAGIRGGSTDVSGQVAFAATGAMSSCLVNFGSAWPNPPNCVCSFEQGNGIPAACGTNTSTTQVNFQLQGNVTNTSFAQINWICISI